MTGRNGNAHREIAEQDEWGKWIDLIPAIKFSPEWEVKVIPPFGGAIVRFLVICKGKTASVYLDCYDRIGFFGEPYWEVYPCNDDVGRCKMNDADGLLSLISESFSDES